MKGRWGGGGEEKSDFYFFLLLVLCDRLLTVHCKEPLCFRREGAL